MGCTEVSDGCLNCYAPEEVTGAGGLGQPPARSHLASKRGYSSCFRRSRREPFARGSAVVIILEVSAMTSQRSVAFAESFRTAAAQGCQLLTLGAVAIGAAVARAKLRPDEVKTVAMGNVVQAGTKMNPARPMRPRGHGRLPRTWSS